MTKYDGKQAVRIMIQKSRHDSHKEKKTIAIKKINGIYFLKVSFFIEG
jgi:hypothetical protein